ncbi:MAG: hypothetical protein R3F60_08465 [bacterium]
MDTDSLARALALLLGGPASPPGVPVVDHLPDRLAERLPDRLAERLAARRRPGPVVWRDAGDEILLHLDTLRVRFQGDALSVGLELECDETGRQAVQVVFYLGDRPQSMLVATEELPRGDARVVGRWGRPLQEALVSALVQLAEAAAAAQPRHVPALQLQQERLVLSVPGAAP